MIICQTPLRVSFFGGGTDFPEFFAKHGGAVLSTAIDKYIYHSITHFHSKLFDYSIRMAYRKVECVSRLADVEHAPILEILRRFGIKKDIEVSLAADLPTFSGLGSSSSFTVGMINSVNAFQGRFVPKTELAKAAIRMERETLRETVGFQDQVIAAYGGLNLVEFSGADKFVVNRVAISKEKMNELEGSLMMFFTGMTRCAGDMEKSKLNNGAPIKDGLKRMLRLVDKAHALLTGNGPLCAFGRLLDATWQEARSLSPTISNPVIDRMHDLALGAGALGGKLLGAGGGGFMLFFVPQERQAKVRKALGKHIEVPFSINAPGSRVIHS